MIRISRSAMEPAYRPQTVVCGSYSASILREM